VIYICIPALDEAPTVGVLLWRIRQVMTEFRRDFHLIVLDDGSTDATAEVLGPYEKVLPLTVLRNERTGGYAAALERLLRETVARSTHPKRDIAVVMQADFTEPPEEIPALVKKLEGGADVVGSAVAAVEGELPRGLRWSRRGLPWLLGRKIPKEGGDPMSGFRAYRVHVIKRALGDREGLPLLTRQGWAANAELLMAVAPHTRRTDQAAVQLRYTRRERETRFNAWPTLRETWELARRAPRRIRAALAPEPAVAPAPAAPPQPRASAPAAEPVPDTAPPREGRRRSRPPRPEPASAPVPPPTAGGAEGVEEAQAPPRERRRRPRKPRAERVTGDAAEVVEAMEAAEDSAAPREGRRRPPRRNRKRGRREGNKEEGQPE
jgi:hypothetical protein